jgi:hypothetical protein
MKYFFVVLFILIIGCRGKTQPTNYSFYQLYQLDSIGKTSSIGRHFGGLYFHFLELIEMKLKTADTATQRMVRNFEIVFAQFYIDACIAYKNHEQIKLAAWRAYFADSLLQPVQYKLLGTNAHLNGGLSEAIANSYTAEQWKQIKPKYYLFNSCLNETFRMLHNEAITTNKQAKKLDMVTLRLDRWVGYYYLYRWRKRQIRLTEFYFTGSPKYKKLNRKVHKKKDRIDTMIRTGL